LRVRVLRAGASGPAVSPYYNWLNPDASAAFPSLHAAFPLLCALAWLVVMRVLAPRIASLRPRPVAAYQPGPAETVPSVPSSVGAGTKAPDATEAVGSGRRRGAAEAVAVGHEDGGPAAIVHRFNWNDYFMGRGVHG
jgi:hypothetical protein